jgi:hypothetical protein
VQALRGSYLICDGDSNDPSFERYWIPGRRCEHEPTLDASAPLDEQFNLGPRQTHELDVPRVAPQYHVPVVLYP